MRAAAANQIMMLAVNPLSSVCTNVHRDQYCTTRIELLVILSFTHFYGRAAAELSFSDLVLRTFTRTMKTVISYNNLELYLYLLDMMMECIFITYEELNMINMVVYLTVNMVFTVLHSIEKSIAFYE